MNCAAAQAAASGRAGTGCTGPGRWRPAAAGPRPGRLWLEKSVEPESDRVPGPARACRGGRSGRGPAAVVTFELPVSHVRAGPCPAALALQVVTVAVLVLR